MIISIHTKNRRRKEEKGVTINFKDDTFGAELAKDYIMTMIRFNHIVTIEWNEK